MRSAARARRPSAVACLRPSSATTGASAEVRASASTDTTASVRRPPAQSTSRRGGPSPPAMSVLTGSLKGNLAATGSAYTGNGVVNSRCDGACDRRRERLWSIGVAIAATVVCYCVNFAGDRPTTTGRSWMPNDAAFGGTHDRRWLTPAAGRLQAAAGGTAVRGRSQIAPCSDDAESVAFPATAGRGGVPRTRDAGPQTKTAATSKRAPASSPNSASAGRGSVRSESRWATLAGSQRSAATSEPERAKGIDREMFAAAAADPEARRFKQQQQQKLQGLPSQKTNCNWCCDSSAGAESAAGPSSLGWLASWWGGAALDGDLVHDDIAAIVRNPDVVGGRRRQQATAHWAASSASGMAGRAPHVAADWPRRWQHAASQVSRPASTAGVLPADKSRVAALKAGNKQSETMNATATIGAATAADTVGAPTPDLSTEPWVFGEMWTNDYWGTPMASPNSHKSYRPITVLTFRLNYLYAGLTSTRSYHVVNVLLHAACCMLLGELAGHLLSPRQQHGVRLTPDRNSIDSERRDRLRLPFDIGEPFILRLTAVLVFAVQPVHSEAVSSIVGRAEVLCGVFFLLALLTFISSCEGEAGLKELTKPDLSRQEDYCCWKVCVFGRRIGPPAEYDCQRHTKERSLSDQLAGGQRALSNCFLLPSDKLINGRMFSYVRFPVSAVLFQRYLGVLHLGGFISRSRLKLWSSMALAALAMLSKEQGLTVLGVFVVYRLRMLAILARREQHCDPPSLEDLPGHSRASSFSPKGIHRLIHLFFTDDHLIASCVTLCVLIVFRICLLAGSLPHFSEHDNPASYQPQRLTRLLTYSYLAALNFAMLLWPRILSYDWQVDSVQLLHSVRDPRNLATGALLVICAGLLRRLAQQSDAAWASSPSSAVALPRGVAEPCDSARFDRSDTERNGSRPLSMPDSHGVGPRVSSCSSNLHRDPCFREVALGRRSEHSNDSLACRCRRRVGVTAVAAAAAAVVADPARDVLRLCGQTVQNRCSTGWPTAQHRGGDVARSPPCAETLLVVGAALLVLPWLPASNLFVTVGFVLAERVLYVPSMGFALLVAGGFLRLLHYLGDADDRVARAIFSRAAGPSPVRRRGASTIGSTPLPACQLAAVAALLVLVVSGATRTVRRNRVWMNRETLFESGVRDMPNNCKVHYNYANLQRDLGHAERAEYYYKLALRQCPSHASAHNNLGTIVVSSHEAEKHFRAAIRINLHHAGAHYNLAMLYRRRGQTELARALLERSLVLDESLAEAASSLAQLEDERGRPQEAEFLHRRAVELNQQSAHIRNNFASFLHQHGRWQEASVEYRKALLLEPTYTAAILNAAETMKKLQGNDEAESLYLRALSINPDDYTVMDQLAVFYAKAKRYYEAEALFVSVLQKNPGYLQSRLHYSQCMLEKGDVRSSEQILLEVLGSGSTDAGQWRDGLRQMALVCSYSNRSEEAATWIQKALYLCPAAGVPECALLHADYGDILKDLSYLNRSAESYTEALRLQPDLAHAHINLGVIRHLQGNYPAAFDHYTLAYSLEPWNHLVVENMKKLRRQILKSFQRPRLNHDAAFEVS